MIKLISQYKFLFEELVSRDFKKKYKRTILGMGWSIIFPLMQLMVMSLIFKQFFGRNQPNYTTYMFCGLIVFNYFKESTSLGMRSLMENRTIISKINVPKYLFLLSKNVSSIINFGLNLLVFFVFAFIDHINFSIKFILLLYPIACLIIFNIGVGLVLSALFVFFRDINYLYDIFTLLLHYCSAIFYTVENFSQKVQFFLHLNPIYCYIKYFRAIVIENRIPSIQFHLLCVFYAVVMILIGLFIYKRFNHRFLYYM